MKREDYKSRKFLLACIFTAVGSVGLFLGNLDGGAYVALATLVLATYGASNVAEKRGNKSNGD